VTGLRIGLLVDQPHKRQYLGMSVAQAGHKLICSAQLGQEAAEALQSSEVDAWVVDVTALPDDNSDYPDDQLLVLENLLESVKVPLIVSDSSEYRPGSEEHNAWLK